MMGNHYIFVALLGLLALVCQAHSQFTVTIYEHPDYKGNSKQVVVNRCENILDFDDQASAIRTTECVIMYEDPCCQGPSARFMRDTPNFPQGTHDLMSSLSPCGNYRAPLPSTIRETWLGHNQTMRKVAEDGDVSIYYNNDMSGKALENHRDYLYNLWEYVKENYGDFGPEGGRLSVYFHSDVEGPQYGFNSLQSYFDRRSSCRNLIDLVGGRDKWSSNLTGVALDIITHEVSHIVEGNSNGISGSPSYRLWGDSKWAEIFMYDVYNALGMNEERDRVAGLWSYPKDKYSWFRDWFLPIYNNNGGVKVLRNYFEMLAKHWPRRHSWQFVERNINLGEFVHFFSGAAGKDLKAQAKIAFPWGDDEEEKLLKAKQEFPNVRY